MFSLLPARSTDYAPGPLRLGYARRARRLAYLTSSILTLAMAGLLFRMVPRQATLARASSYMDLVRSLFGLFRDEPLLTVRGVLALLIFAAFNVLWVPLVLPLSTPPFSLSHTAIGLFGLAGLAGELGAGRAGRLADLGFSQRTTGLSLALMFASWLPIALMEYSLWALKAL